jgi:hypothetical protein
LKLLNKQQKNNFFSLRNIMVHTSFQRKKLCVFIARAYILIPTSFSYSASSQYLRNNKAQLQGCTAALPDLPQQCQWQVPTNQFEGMWFGVTVHLKAIGSVSFTYYYCKMRLWRKE